MCDKNILFYLCAVIHHKILIMAYTQRTYSTWTKTNSSSNFTPKATSRESVLFKLAILIALAYWIWGGDVPGLEQDVTAAITGKKVAQSVPPELLRQRNAPDYVQRFAPVAQAEMNKFGIPASIILAQALLESEAGNSELAVEANNHFGIKCFSKKCKKDHCMNATDDTHKDFFIKYSNAWSSFRAHSKFLKGTPRYASLFKKKDYRSWAKGLAAAGYATDKQYGDKLIRIIETMKLDQYDEVSVP